MAENRFKNIEYQGFEQGPIRPPSEAGSLLIRITRNCPWNRCTFCSVYTGSDFSLRPVEHVLHDINSVYRYVYEIRKKSILGQFSPAEISQMVELEPGHDPLALNATLQWAANGMKSIFLQDANSLIVQPERLITILTHIQNCFPWVQRVTSYARSQTIARISDENLDLFARAGLNRIHVGMESGSDKVLFAVKKGVDKKTHIKAGLKVKKAGMELSEYVMPGLGGASLSREHAVETADALNEINPNFIRLRTLAIPKYAEMFSKYKTGEFRKLNGVETAYELLTFLEHLDGITSSLKSDHVLNLFEDLEGHFPKDKEKMMGTVSDFLNMSLIDQITYQVGRKMGMFRGLKDLRESRISKQVEQICKHKTITSENADAVIKMIIKIIS